VFQKKQGLRGTGKLVGERISQSNGRKRGRLLDGAWGSRYSNKNKDVSWGTRGKGGYDKKKKRQKRVEQVRKMEKRVISQRQFLLPASGTARTAGAGRGGGRNDGLPSHLPCRKESNSRGWMKGEGKLPRKWIEGKKNLWNRMGGGKQSKV